MEEEKGKTGARYSIFTTNSYNLKLFVLLALLFSVFGNLNRPSGHYRIDSGLFVCFLIAASSILMAKYILTIKQSLVSMLLGMIAIILMGTFLLTLDSHEARADISAMVPSLACFSFVLFVIIIKGAKPQEAAIKAVDRVQGLVKLCFDSGNFILLFSASLWLLFSGSYILSAVRNTHFDEVMLFAAGLIDSLTIFALAYFIIFIGMLLVTKKVKKSLRTVIMFVLMLFVSAPVCLVLFSVLLSISERLVRFFS